jgi:hypothetical protein
VALKARIGIAETNKVVELEVADPTEFESQVESAYAGDSSLLWFEDSKKRRVGIPRDRLGFVEIDIDADRTAVGFGS